ncbi:TPA: YSIRK-type signal peptide-containing protein, partial [Streptococcus suis]
MRKSTKKSFDWYGMRQHFSIRKYHFGAASVLLGMSLALGAGAQVVQAETSASSSVVVATTSSSETVPTETVASSTTEAVVTEATVASTTETVATTARTATINYIVQYVAEDGTVVKADVLSTTVDTTETTATTSVSVNVEAPTGYVLPTGQTAVVTQDVTENAINLLTVKVVKNAEEKAIETTATTEKPTATTVTETKPEVASTTESVPATTASTETATAKSTEDAATTTATVAETVKTPATVEEAKVVLEQVTSEAEVLANESERLVAASDKENTALKAAAAATKLTATEATAVLNDSTATLEAVNAQIDAVRTNVEALALELRKFLGTDLIQVALTTTTDMNNATGHNGVWTEEVTVTNKDEAVKTATTTSATPDIPAGFLADPTDGRMTFMIYHLSGNRDSEFDGTTADGSFNLRMGTDYYMVLSVNRDKSKGESIYVNIYDKATNQIAIDANGNVAPEVEVPIGTTKSLDFLNNLAKTKEIAKRYNFTVNVTDTTLSNDAGESFVYRVLQIRNGVGGSGRQTIVYSTQTTSRESYNSFTGTAPNNDPSQTTYYYVKGTANREEELLAKYIQIGDIVSDHFTIPSAATFDDYELIEKPTSESGTLGTNFVQGASIVSYYPDYLQARVQYISKKDGTSRFLQFVLNPDHDDLFANVNTYSKYTQTTFQDVANEVLRLDERVALAEQVEADIAAVNADTSLTNEQKEAKIKRIRAAGAVQANSADDIFLLAFTGQEVPPQGYNNDADVITGLTTWNYTSTKYKFRDTGQGGAVYDSIQGFLTEYSGNPLALRSFPNKSYLVLIDKNVTESTLTGNQAHRYDIINPLTNSLVKIQAIQLSMFNGLALTDSERAYYYAEKGGLKVYYVDTEGTVIKNENFVMPHENTDTPYNTDTEEVKPKTITYKGEVYYYKEIDMISDNSLVPASENTETEKRTIEKIDQETGVIEQDTLKELTYVYEKAGNVNINYVDTDGVPLRNKVIDVENGKPGSDYNTAQNKAEKPDTITTDDGTVYHLVLAGDYPVGNVSDNNNLTSVGNGKATGIDPVTGTVVAGETKEITYVYQKAGSVNINYVDTNGKELQPKLADVENGKPGSDYDTAQNKTEKPDTITTEDGTVYHLVPAGDYPVGNVSDTNNLTSVGNGRATGIDPVTGEVVAGETKEITYVYQKAGNVNVNYVDTKGNVIKDKVADEVNEPAGTDYDTVVDNKPEKITTEDGKVYYLAPAATYEVGTVSDDNNLTSVGNGTATGIDPITGEVEAGETKEITYVYQEAGHVNVNYVDT